jgi:hypothetical protein
MREQVTHRKSEREKEEIEAAAALFTSLRALLRRDIPAPSTTTTTVPTPPSILDFTVGIGGATCGSATNSSNTVLKVLHCGGLNIGGGMSTVREGPTPDGTTNRFALSCSGGS